MDLTVSGYTSAISAFVALFSLVIAGLSYANSRKALKITQYDHQEKFRSIQSYLVQSFSFTHHQRKYCSFAITYSNLASQGQSISTIDLEIEGFDANGLFNRLILPINSAVIPKGLAEGYRKIVPPLNLSAKESVSGWVTFALPRETDVRIRIEQYKVIGKLPTGENCEVISHIMQMVSDEAKD